MGAKKMKQILYIGLFVFDVAGVGTFLYLLQAFGNI